MKIDENLHWDKKQIDIEIDGSTQSETFNISIVEDEEIEIGFDWNHGYDGRGTSYAFIPVKTLRELLDKVYGK